MQKHFKITGLETDLLKTPGGTPNYDAIHKMGVDTGMVVLCLKTDAGMNAGTVPAPEAPGMTSEVNPDLIRKFKVG